MRIEDFGKELRLRADDRFVGGKDLVAGEDLEIAVFGVAYETLGDTFSNCPDTRTHKAYDAMDDFTP